MDATSNQKMSLNTRVYSGSYYAVIGYGNCYSDCVAVAIIINEAAASTGEKIQYFCREKEDTIADIITNEQRITKAGLLHLNQ